MILLAMPDAGAQTHAVSQLRRIGFGGRIISGVRRRGAMQPTLDAGADLVFDIADAAGVGLGERALECLGPKT